MRRIASFVSSTEIAGPELRGEEWSGSSEASGSGARYPTSRNVVRLERTTQEAVKAMEGDRGDAVWAGGASMPAGAADTESDSSLAISTTVAGLEYN